MMKLWRSQLCICATAVAFMRGRGRHGARWGLGWSACSRGCEESLRIFELLLSLQDKDRPGEEDGRADRFEQD